MIRLLRRRPVIRLDGVTFLKGLNKNFSHQEAVILLLLLLDG